MQLSRFYVEVMDLQKNEKEYLITQAFLARLSLLENSERYYSPNG